MTGEMLIQDELSRETAVFVAPFFLIKQLFEENPVISENGKKLHS